MDFSNLTDGIILLISGGIIVLFGCGILLPNLASQENVDKEKMEMVLVIGLVIVLFCVVQLARHLL
jgi:zinc transporter ZupT